MATQRTPSFSYFPFKVPSRSHLVIGADQATLDQLRTDNLVLLGKKYKIQSEVFINKWNELNQIYINDPNSFFILVKLAFDMATSKNITRHILKYKIVRIKYSPYISIAFNRDYKEILLNLVENHPITNKVHLFVPPQISDDEDAN